MRFRNIYITIKRHIRKEFTKKYLIFFIFFGLASLLWFVNALGKQYNTTISIQVEYQNIPKTKAIVNSVPRTINVDVTASGFSLLHYYWRSKQKRVVINIGKLIANSFEWTNTLYIPTNSGNDILSRFDAAFTIRKVSPDTIVFKFANISSKRVPIKPNVALTFEQQFELKNAISIQPNYVVIYGAQQILDKIDSISTVPFKKDNIFESFSQKLTFQKLSNVSFSDSACVIKVMVEKFTEQSISIPILSIHVPDSLVIDLMKERVQVTILVGLSKINNYKSSDFKAIADFSKLDKKTGLIPVEIILKPQFVRIVSQDPIKIGYIIDSK